MVLVLLVKPRANNAAGITTAKAPYAADHAAETRPVKSQVRALTWLFTGRVSAAWSAAYGALAVVIPAALFARGLTSKTSTINVGTAVFAFLLWEMVKMGLTIAMLYAAIWVVKDLSWPAMLAGLVVTMKVYWVVFAWRKVFHPQA